MKLQKNSAPSNSGQCGPDPAPPMHFSLSSALLPCPACGALVNVHGERENRGDPEYLTAKCDDCGMLIQAKRDTITGEWIFEAVRPS